MRQRSDKPTDKAAAAKRAANPPTNCAGTSKIFYEKPQTLYVSHISIAIVSDAAKEERRPRLIRAQLEFRLYLGWLGLSRPVSPAVHAAAGFDIASCSVELRHNLVLFNTGYRSSEKSLVAR